MQKAEHDQVDDAYIVSFGAVEEITTYKNIKYKHHRQSKFYFPIKTWNDFRQVIIIHIYMYMYVYLSSDFEQHFVN